jgi:hypothetical protein
MERRTDLTDYVIHFTSEASRPTVLAEGVLRQILRDGHIKPSFSPMSNRHSKGVKHNTVKGPDPVKSSRPSRCRGFTLRTNEGRR